MRAGSGEGYSIARSHTVPTLHANSSEENQKKEIENNEPIYHEHH